MDSTKSAKETNGNFNRETQGIMPFYHMVSDHDVAYVKHLYSYRSVSAFERDLDYFLRAYRPIDLHELRQSVANGGGMPERGFFLSFDDGFRELFEIVRPMLLRKGIPATFFLNKAFLDNKALFYRNKVSLLIEQYLTQPDSYAPADIEAFLSDHGVFGSNFKDRIKSIEYPRRELIDGLADLMGFNEQEWLNKVQPYLNSEQVRTMVNDGFAFGGHSIDHPKYSTIAIDEQLRQARESVDFVHNSFNLDYRVFAFPFHDQFVSKRFFESVEAEGIAELTFGTAELQSDPVRFNLQRMWFENTDLPPEEVVETCFSNKLERIAAKSDVIRRPFSGLRSFTVAELNEALETGFFWGMDAEHLPITRYRARAHAANPRAHDSDLAMVTMYDGDALIGYLGVLPDVVYPNGEPLKIGWLTCWWTHPEYSGKGIGQSILDRIYDHCNGFVGCSEFTALGQQAAERSGKLEKFPIPGKVFNLETLQACGEWLAKQHIPDLEYINEIDGEAEHFIRSSQNGALARRGKTELNWMLRYPWVITAPFADRSKNRLFFSSTAQRFFFQSFKVYSSDARLIGVVILRIRDRQMTVPYAFLNGSAADQQHVVNAIALHAAANEVEKVKVYHPVVCELLQTSGLPLDSQETVVKNAFFSERYDAAGIRAAFIQDGDGDNAFT